MLKQIFSIIGLFLFTALIGQSISLSTSQNIFCATGKDSIRFNLVASGIPPNTDIDIFESTDSLFNPYNNEGTKIATIPGNALPVDTINFKECLRVLGIFIDACGVAGTEPRNEYLIMSSGNGINVSDIQVDFDAANNGFDPSNLDINQGTSLCSFHTPDPTLIANLRVGICNSANVIPVGPTDSIPEKVIILCFTSDSVNNIYDISNLCILGYPIYVIQSSCTRTIGAFTNASSCSTTPSTRYRTTIVKDKLDNCTDKFVYDRCNIFNKDGTYAIRQEGVDTASVANKGININAIDSCGGIDYTQIKFNADTLITLALDTATNCNTGNHYIKAVFNPSNAVQTVSNKIFYNLICLDILTNKDRDTVCTSDATSILVSSNDNNAIFSWSHSNSPAISGASNGTGNFISQVLTNNSTKIDSIVYYITAKDTSCSISKQVVVYVFPSLTKPDLGADLSLCSPINQSLTTGDATTSWTLNGTSIANNQATITATQAGTYIATISNSCDSVSDTIQITQTTTPVKPFIGNDTSFCSNFILQLSTGNPVTNWYREGNFLSISSGITTAAFGTYVAVISNSCGTVSDTIVISQIPAPTKPNLGADLSLCSPINQILTTGDATTSWTLNGTSIANNQATIIATQAGTYIATITNSCGTVRDTIVISQGTSATKPNLGADLSLCSPISQSLTTDDATTSWMLNGTSIANNQATITATQAGIYIATITNSCGTVRDTIVITQSNTPTKPNLGIDLSLCSPINQSLTTGDATTSWTLNGTSIANNQTTITATQAGTYIATITNSCGTVRDTIVISQGTLATKPNLGADLSLCSPISQSLTTGDATTSWTLNGTSIANNQATITATQAGTYIATITNSCGTVRDTIVITQLSVPAKPDLGSDIKLKPDETITIESNNINTIWNTGVMGLSIEVSEEGMYIATVSNSCGTSSDTIIVIIDTTDFYGDCIFLPNTFTPNNNNRNDIFRILGENVSKLNIFRIFDRWGNLVFESTNIAIGWDGTYKGKLLDSGVYHYYIEAICEDGNTYFNKGDVMLIR